MDWMVDRRNVLRTLAGGAGLMAGMNSLGEAVGDVPLDLALAQEANGAYEVLVKVSLTVSGVPVLDSIRGELFDLRVALPDEKE